MPSILGANTLSSDYDVANSVRFDDASNCQMRRAGVSGGNQDKFTLSMWIKRSAISTDHPRLFTSVASGDDRFEIYFENTDELHIEGVDNGTATLNLVTSRKFRDVAAWYHILLAVDTGQGTEANRAKLYINGVLETAFSTSTRPDQDGNIGINTNSFPLQIGEADNYGVDFDGYFAEIVFLDGTQSANTDFGKFDSNSGIWKPIDVEGLSSSKGNNGFYLDFEASDNLGNDVFGGTDFSEANLAAIDQTTDTCTNNFATIDVLSTNLFDPDTTVFSEGNLKHVAGQNAGYNGLWRSNIGVNSGKWYAEFKLGSHTRTAGHGFGIYRDNTSFNGTDGQLPYNDLIRIIFADTSLYVSKFGSTVQTGLASTSTNDIFGIYMDIDNGKLSVQKNGSDYITQITGLTTAGYTWFFFTQGEVQSSRTLTFEHNYGNPTFSISSGNTDPNGYGNFEFSTTHSSVDYYALNTKNLAEYG